MRTLVLDYSKWRCGDRSPINQLGKGITALLNPVGDMCCLGQFSLQLDKSLTKNDIMYLSFPEDLNRRIPLLMKKNKYAVDFYVHTQFSVQAMNINDDSETTPVQKISKLRSLCKKYKYKLRVIKMIK